MKARKAKRQLHLFREPSYMGGLCVVCRKRQRDIKHVDKPHMCAHCRDTRVKSLFDSLPMNVQEHSLHLERTLDRGVQNLNIPVLPPIRRTHTQVKPIEHGPDVTTPDYAQVKVSSRVQELMEKLKNF